MKKGEFWALLLTGLMVLVWSLMLGTAGFNLFFVMIMLVGMIIVLFAGRFFGYGRPQTHLPAGENFQKISEFRSKDNIVFLTLKHVKDKVVFIDPQNGDNILHNDIRLYKIRADILLDKFGHEIEEIPEKFDVKISKRIVPGQEFEKYPNLEKVYYIIPSSSKSKTESESWI
ncbi:MAG TPA: hypothetical protein VMW82_01895 [Candidatus Paceibacterota bacterium]|nr:hypothetical protein [Candidatus Paceibacterota bacterium]